MGGLSEIYNAPLSHEDGCSIIKEVFNRGVTFLIHQISKDTIMIMKSWLVR
jgi:hypothetical protein